MFRINSATGVIDMPPTLDPMNENLNFEDDNPNPYTLLIALTDNGIPPANSTVLFSIHVLDQVCSRRNMILAVVHSIWGTQNDVPRLATFPYFGVEEKLAPVVILYDVDVYDDDESRGKVAGDWGEKCSVVLCVRQRTCASESSCAVWCSLVRNRWRRRFQRL
jgi:hypothetical protein